MIKHKDESIFIDFEYTDGEIPDGYKAYYYLSNNEKILKTKELNKNPQNTTFELRIKSGELSDFKDGSYLLEIAVVNEEIGYKDYIFSENLILRSKNI